MLANLWKQANRDRWRKNSPKDGGFIMKIANYAIAMQSQHQFQASYVKTESLNTWRDQPANNPKLPNRSLQQWLEDELKISEQAKEALKKETQSMSGIAETEDESWLSPRDKQKIQILESMLSALLGRKVKLYIPKRIHSEDAGRAMAQFRANIANVQQQTTLKAEQTQIRQGWGFVYERQESYKESERLSFAASGIIKTADGREIDFKVQLNITREFAASNQLTVKAGDALMDPLVINYDGPAAQLTERKYQFDLDSDGREDQISFLKEGSGFLAIDINNDGTINNGRELFGPATGNGFTELAQYDQDGNGWIDESDPIFNKLRIWSKDDQGHDTLFALGEKGIGAIFLGNISAEFGLKDNANQLQGQARTGGVFVRENGTAGLVQQLDLVV
jgi:hypothetical protein